MVEPRRAGQPAVVYDGTDLWEQAPALSAALVCPACAAPLQIAMAAVLAAPAAPLSGDPWVEALIDQGLLRRRGAGPFAALVDALALRAHLLRHRCPRCAAAIVSAWGHGEFQPARYLATWIAAAEDAVP